MHKEIQTTHIGIPDPSLSLSSLSLFLNMPIYLFQAETLGVPQICIPLPCSCARYPLSLQPPQPFPKCSSHYPWLPLSSPFSQLHNTLSLLYFELIQTHHELSQFRGTEERQLFMESQLTARRNTSSRDLHDVVNAVQLWRSHGPRKATCLALQNKSLLGYKHPEGRIRFHYSFVPLYS